MQKLVGVACLVSFGLLGCVSTQMPNAADHVRDPNCKVNESIKRNPIPKTPQNMSLPRFGQGIIGWATGPEGAAMRLKNIQKSDVKAIQRLKWSRSGKHFMNMKRFVIRVIPLRRIVPS